MIDCLIAGAGVVGLSLAYELAGHGWKVHVIDRGSSGREASWAGAGILPPAHRRAVLDPLDQLRAWSHRLHAEWADRLRRETGIDTGYRRCGGLYLAMTPGEAAALHGLAADFQEVGVDMEHLSKDQLVELEPNLRVLAATGRLFAAYRARDESQLRNPDHLRALAIACRQQGVVIEEHTELEQLASRNGRVVGWQTNRGVRQAEHFCVTTGAWTYRILHDVGVESGILPIKGQMVMYGCPTQLVTHVLNVGPRYLVPRDDGRLLVGSTEEEAGFDKRTTEEAIDDLRSLAERLLPELREMPVERTWAGLRPGTFDGMPYLGRVPGHENFYVAAGHFRSGLHLSPATAAVMSQLIRGDEPEVDLTPFRVSRG